jgi:hypothetical protein
MPQRVTLSGYQGWGYHEHGRLAEPTAGRRQQLFFYSSSSFAWIGLFKSLFRLQDFM